MFKLCQDCNSSTKNMIWTLCLFVLALVLVLACTKYRQKKRKEAKADSVDRQPKKKEKEKKKAGIMSGVKILLVLYQILASLPNVVPAIALPANFKESMKVLLPFSLNLFELVPMGCFVKQESFRYYEMVIGMVAAPLCVCVVFGLRAALTKGEVRQVSRTHTHADDTHTSTVHAQTSGPKLRWRARK